MKVCLACQEADEGARRYDRKIAGATVVVHYPKGSSYDERGVLTPNPELAKRLAHKLESSGAVAIPRDVAQLLETAGLESPGWKIELLSDGGSLQSGFTGRLEYLDKLKVRGILAPERTVLEGQHGTLAEAEAHADVALTQADLTHQYVVDQLNLQVVDSLLALNFGQHARGAVQVVPAPIVDAKRSFYRDLYKTLLANPNFQTHELSALDLDALKDTLGLPKSTEIDARGKQPISPGLLNPGAIACGDSDDEEGHWVTIDGHPVLIDGPAPKSIKSRNNVLAQVRNSRRNRAAHAPDVAPWDEEVKKALPAPAYRGKEDDRIPPSADLPGRKKAFDRIVDTWIALGGPVGDMAYYFRSKSDPPYVVNWQMPSGRARAEVGGRNLYFAPSDTFDAFNMVDQKHNHWMSDGTNYWALVQCVTVAHEMGHAVAGLLDPKGDSHLVGGSVALENVARKYLDFYELSRSPLPGETGKPVEVKARTQYSGNAEVPLDSQSLEKSATEGTKEKASIAQGELNKWQELQGKLQIPESVKQVRKEFLTEVVQRVEKRLDFAKDIGRKSEDKERQSQLETAVETLRSMRQLYPKEIHEGPLAIRLCELKTRLSGDETLQSMIQKSKGSTLQRQKDKDIPLGKKVEEVMQQ